MISIFEFHLRRNLKNQQTKLYFTYSQIWATYASSESVVPFSKTGKKFLSGMNLIRLVSFGQNACLSRPARNAL